MLETAALAAGMSWASGLRLYLAVLTAGVLARLGWLDLPSGLQAEFVADKVPGFDTVWDGIQTFIRIPAGAILAAAAFGNMDPQWTVAAGLIGGTLAGTAHAAKAGTRALINVSPEPFSNWVASFTEDVGTVGGLLLAFFLPVVFLILLVLFLVLAAWLVPKLWRGARRLHASLRDKGQASPPAKQALKRPPHRP
jgi:Domain of unknown function (DUF4126)